MKHHNSSSFKSPNDSTGSNITINKDTLLLHANNLISTPEIEKVNNNFFTLMPANSWIERAKTKPIPQMLFGEFWFEGELCILFSDTNLGKSILGVQIGDSISKGIAISGFKLEANKQPILYYDFELSEKQFEERYSMQYTNHYNFDNNFIRVEINKDAEIPDNIPIDDFLYQSLEQNIVETGSKILIIDNITYLKDDNEKAKDALPLMKYLKSIKSKYNLSILVLAHTPKRDLSKPISKNDLSGSKMLMNFCDTSFSIGESSKDNAIRYLKQIKQRNTEQIYNSENVCVCQIEKPSNFLHFHFLSLGKENEHLHSASAKEKENQLKRVIELNQLGKSLREIGSEIGISHMKVHRMLNNCNTL